MTTPRLFLVAPDGPAPHVAACIKAACAAGDVASLLLPPSLAKELTPTAQALGLAVLTTGEPRDALRAGCDGLHADADSENLAGLRESLGKNNILGVYAAGSRHLAMEAAEAGADYVALNQNSASIGGEPIVKWCAEFLEVPCVAFAPVEAEGLDTLLPQKPDFIRPADAMWDDADTARRIVTQLMQRMNA
jgi:thiamine-phosphate pyrophosphorylase